MSGIDEQEMEFPLCESCNSTAYWKISSFDYDEVGFLDSKEHVSMHETRRVNLAYCSETWSLKRMKDEITRFECNKCECIVLSGNIFVALETYLERYWDERG